MTLFNTFKETVNTAVDTISTVTQNLVEKNRTNAKLNRLRIIMKNESELMNRAYIALGKHYYEMQKNGSVKNDGSSEKLVEVIEKSKAKITKARECYREIVDSQNDVFYGKVEKVEHSSDEIVDITVACSNESEYGTSPFASKTDSSKNAEATAENVAETGAEGVADNLEEAGTENVAENPEEVGAESIAENSESVFAEDVAQQSTENVAQQSDENATQQSVDAKAEEELVDITLASNEDVFDVVAEENPELDDEEAPNGELF